MQALFLDPWLFHHQTCCSQYSCLCCSCELRAPTCFVLRPTHLYLCTSLGHHDPLPGLVRESVLFYAFYAC